MANDTVTNRDRRWRLEDERDFLVRSLRDADAEHDAGDLNEADYEALRRRDADRLAAVEAALEGLDAKSADAKSADANEPSADAKTPQAEAGSDRAQDEEVADEEAAGASRAEPSGHRSSQRTRRRRRNLLGVVGVLAIAAALVVLVVALVSPRLPGEASSGSVNLSPSQEVERQLEQAAALVDQGKLASAAHCVPARAARGAPSAPGPGRERMDRVRGRGDDGLVVADRQGAHVGRGGGPGPA